MRKLAFFGLALLVLAGCEDDDPPVTTPEFPTDGLSLPKRVNSLLLTNYASGNSASTSYEVARLVNESSFGGGLNHLSLATAQGNAFYSIISDSMSANFLSLPTPSFVVDFESVLPTGLEDAIDAQLNKKPMLAVTHAITSNDTAWIVDNKVKFFEDTLSSGIFIQTYLLGKVRAKLFNNTDLNVGPVNNLTKQTDDESFWDATIPNLDSSANAITKNSAINHQWVLLQSFKETTWGTQLGTYWPFGPEFYENDIIGTRDTPIRHYFLKPKSGDYPFTFSPQFISVVWILNPFTNNWEYVNSFQTN